jgi:hypothetical protein
MPLTDSKDGFPFVGEFYRVVSDNTNPLIAVESRVSVLVTECDIQENGTRSSQTLTKAGYAIYFPMDIFADTFEMKVENGMWFEGSMYGSTIIGKVIAIYPSTLGFVTAYIEEKTVHND